MSLFDFLLTTVVMSVGAALHGSVGIGLALVAAPLLLLIDPTFVPGPLILAGLFLVLAMALREGRAADRGELIWAVVGCIVGTGAAAVVLTVTSPSAFDLVFGLMLLLAVGLSLVPRTIPVDRRMVFGAGALSGLMGTTTSIGGPPLALVFQKSSAPRLRATMAVYFVAAGTLALGGLAIAGRFWLAEIERGAYLMPGLVLGLLVSNRTRSWLRIDLVRPAILALCAIAGFAILIRFFS
jgi:uncharacterized membrane protein YfcA